MPDILPTLAEAGGATYPVEVAGRDPLPLEGISMLASLRGQATDRDRAQFYEHMGNAAVRRGRWKLVLNGQLVEGAPPEDAVHLADLDADAGERRNLRDAEPGIAEELRAAATAWRAGIEARWTDEWHGGKG
jgi:arylsulfatase